MNRNYEFRAFLAGQSLTGLTSGSLQMGTRVSAMRRENKEIAERAVLLFSKALKRTKIKEE